MTLLYTVAYPSLIPGDQEFIEQFRSENDPQFHLVRPHFTLVFGVSNVSPDDYLAHVEAIASASYSIAFHCRYAMLGSDHETERGVVYLVPDEGNSMLSRLHDSLYTGVLAGNLRLDREFVPHITIGSVRSRDHAKRLCGELNAQGISIAGIVAEVTIIGIENGTASELAKFPLLEDMKV